MTARIAVWPDGTVSTDPDTIDALMTELAADGTDVVMLASPVAAAWRNRRHRRVVPLVGYIDDWGATKHPVNMKAWALYGRSPIYGPMVIKDDLDLDLPAGLVDMLERSIDDWVAEDVLERMGTFLGPR